MMCKDCKNRQLDKYCKQIKQFVPRKKRQDGTNPAETCGKFNPKRLMRKESAA